ncbi:MAG: mannosyltransferase family protein [Leptolyngbyaceae cyanobacterium bins.302]|nr:mannosyltransferase family protein [Leptolyngbyaceae cyanobacterium bins.302]
MINSTLQKIVKLEGIPFILLMWLLSRIVILIGLQIIAPLVVTSPVHLEWDWVNRPHGFIPGYIPQAGWEVFSHWDGKWYRTIATVGYEFADDEYQHAVAFFPLFPLIVRGLMLIGLPFEVAGVLVNNVAFLGAMFTLYGWVEDTQDTRVAKWVTAVLAWLPSSLFGTVIYTEGLFLLVATQALWAFDQQRYGWAAGWGALASATRVPGMLLLPAFLIVAWRDRRPVQAYLAGLATSTGLLLYCGYTAIAFGEPLAFLKTRVGWAHNASWLTTLKRALTLDQGSIVSILVLLLSFYLVWHLRSKLPPVAVAYAACVLLLLLGSGSASFYRYLYGIPTTSFAIGLLLADRPRLGYALMGFFAVSLLTEAVHFAAWDWVRWD